VSLRLDSLLHMLFPRSVSGRSCNRVTYTDRRICVSKGSSVDISCTYNSYFGVESKFWFSPERNRSWQNPSEPEDLGKDSQYSGRVQVLEAERGRSTLRITDLTERESADYRFKFKTQSFEWRSSLPGTTLTVTGTDQHKLTNTVTHFKIFFASLSNKLLSVSVSPSGEIVEGSSVTLTCSSDANPAANYTWYKENLKLFQGPEGVYHFTSISSEDRGKYYCKSENQYGQINSTSLFIDVQCKSHESVLFSMGSEGSSVTLTCSSDANPAANYTWYKENEDSPKASGQIFTITDLRPEHSGNYYCEAQNTRGRRNSTLNLTVVGAVSLTAAASGFVVFLLSVPGNV
uniref:Ig-like domain-containing protein n=1 Tax=Seriola lalandi dorsalis TaxID=1841481 RepID=A0A3B4YJX0_SERLL